MPTLDDATALLRSGLSERGSLPQVVRDFQALVNHRSRSGLVLEEGPGEILSDLAWDLDFCESEEAIVKEIKRALARLGGEPPGEG